MSFVAIEAKHVSFGERQERVTTDEGPFLQSARRIRFKLLRLLNANANVLLLGGSLVA